MDAVNEFLNLMRRLRDPQQGCPWVVRQDFSTIAPYTVEEAYEVADAIAREAWKELCDELGDLLLQVAFHAQMAQERGFFNFEDVVAATCQKMIDRHPHVFGDVGPRSEAEIKAHWETFKHQERSQRGADGTLSGVPHAQPALTRAYKLQRRAARVGFDWDSAPPVLEKIEEELQELREAPDAQAQASEIGDLLFAVVNYARHCGQRPEELLHQACTRFSRRFECMEAQLQEQGESVENIEAQRWEELWDRAKQTERSKI